MKKELIVKKKKILTRISVSEYRQLLAFVEEIYLADYDLKILLARKCSNLFFALLELTLEEDGARVRRLYEEKFSHKDKPVIISDRALPYFAKRIADGAMGRILIADDVIIHGRTIYQLFKTLEELAGENEITIDVRSFAENENDVLKEPCIQNAVVHKKVSLHEWRAIVDTIIDVLYLAGQPYTSYIPNIIIKSGSKQGGAIEKFLQEQEVCELHNRTHSSMNLYSYAWIDPETWKFALFQSMRIYINEELGQYVAAPMVSLLPVPEESLLSYREILEDYILEDFYKKMPDFSSELNYRAVVYVISALWSRYFFLKYAECTEIAEIYENPLEEEVNFGSRILKWERFEKLCLNEIVDLSKRLEQAYIPVDNEILLNLSQDFTVLGNKISVLEENIDKEDMNSCIQQFLNINGDLDEDEWKKYVLRQTKRPVRLSGYPFSALAARLVKEGDQAFSQVLKAIDFGKGSIVAKEYQKGDSVYFVSLLHAGEQNYKYIEEKYFPFLYGLFEIEKMAGGRETDACEYKKRYMKEFKRYIEVDRREETAGYEDEEMGKLCKSDITTAYKTVLINDAWSYPHRELLDSAIKLADKIMNNGDNTDEWKQNER